MRSRTNSFCVSAIGAVALLSTAWISGIPAPAQGKCVAPQGIAVPQVRGQVSDAFGIAVPYAKVTVLGIQGAVQTTADDTGRFSFEVPPGHYVFKAEAQGFAYSSAELKVGWNLHTLLRTQKLNVMLGFADSYCPLVTTSKKEFEDAAEANFTRLKESARIMDASQSEDTSRTGKTRERKQASQTQKTSPTEDTSQTHATQK